MKTRSIINKTLGMVSMIPANISAAMIIVINELKALVDAPVMEPRRVKVPVRVQRSEFSDRSNY